MTNLRTVNVYQSFSNCDPTNNALLFNNGSKHAVTVGRSNEEEGETITCLLSPWLQRLICDTSVDDKNTKLSKRYGNDTYVSYSD